jgi:tetratricopeptide (TPR) repeat protein
MLSTAQQDFLAGEDPMRAYRQLYAADRMLEAGVEFPGVLELAEAASSGVEAALTIPVPTLAVMADELRDARMRANANGQRLPVKDVQPNILGNILRGRIEDLIGWSLFNQDKMTDALTHLRRAISVLPEGTAWWRRAQWHLGAALDATGNLQAALAAYLKSYNPYAPDPLRRAIIESLYRKLNGSLEGLDLKIGPASPATPRPSGRSTMQQPGSATSTTPEPVQATPPSTPPPLQ